MLNLLIGKNRRFNVFRALTILCSTVEQHFPFMTKDVHIQVIYIKNLLRSLSYLSVQRSRFLEIILSKLIRMDVRFKNERRKVIF
jgi:hypothetical protein